VVVVVVSTFIFMLISCFCSIYQIDPNG